jgi:hypothetical protein
MATHNLAESYKAHVIVTLLSEKMQKGRGDE